MEIETHLILQKKEAGGQRTSARNGKKATLYSYVIIQGYIELSKSFFMALSHFLFYLYSYM